jgi:hypothetical protein
MRMRHPEWFGGVFHLTDADGLGPFGLEIAREFGIDANCAFNLHLLACLSFNDAGIAVTKTCSSADAIIPGQTWSWQ